MKSDGDTGRLQAGSEALKMAIREDRAAGCALLCAFLDTEIIFQEDGAAAQEVTPLWDLYCRECTLEQEAEALGLPPSLEGQVCKLPDSRAAARSLADHLAGRRLHLPKGELTAGQLLDGFTAYCRDELGIEIDNHTATWGGRCFSSSGRCHHVLIRPRPVLLRPHPQAFILLLCDLPETGTDAIVKLFVDGAGHRQRLAMVDLEKGYKINLTRSDVFVQFERYLRRMHGLRLAVHPELTRGLVDGGIMKLEMG